MRKEGSTNTQTHKSSGESEDGAHTQAAVGGRKSDLIHYSAAQGMHRAPGSKPRSAPPAAPTCPAGAGRQPGLAQPPAASLDPGRASRGHSSQMRSGEAGERCSSCQLCTASFFRWSVKTCGRQTAGVGVLGGGLGLDQGESLCGADARVGVGQQMHGWVWVSRGAGTAGRCCCWPWLLLLLLCSAPSARAAARPDHCGVISMGGTCGGTCRRGIS